MIEILKKHVGECIGPYTLSYNLTSGGVFMEKVTIGLIGAGRIGKLHAENLIKMNQTQVKTVVDVYTDSLHEWAENLGIENVTKDYKDIINDPAINAVFICSSTDTHVQLIVEAAAANKHIFCEKPISLDIEETKIALEAVKKAGVKLQVGFNRRFDKQYRALYQAVQENKVGDPHVIKITSRDPEPPSEEYVKRSGGLFIDMAIHDFDMARFISGSEVEEVYVQGAVLINESFKQYGDVDTAIITLKFKNGALGVIDNSRKAVYGYDQRLEVFGSKGCASISNETASTVEISSIDGVNKEKPKHFFIERYLDAYIAETQEFISSILQNKPVSVSGYDALQAERIALAAKESFQTGKPIKLESFQKILRKEEGLM